MSAKDNGGPAFGEFEKCGDLAVRRGGLSLRDYFAAKVMQGLCAHTVWGNKPYDEVAEVAYKQADAMLLERAK